jgi:hypothetical protein
MREHLIGGTAWSHVTAIRAGSVSKNACEHAPTILRSQLRSAAIFWEVGEKLPARSSTLKSNDGLERVWN